jgi:tetratricopeptide (TPR) repeat protein
MLRALSTIGITAGIVACSSGAFAQDAPADTGATAEGEADPCAGGSQETQARSLFEAGRTAYESARFEQALRHFREAYELCPRPALLFNIGSAADRLHQNELALRSFRDYLAAVPDAPNREFVQNRADDLERAIANDAHAAIVTPVATTQNTDVTGQWWFWTIIAASVVVVAAVVIGISVAATSGPEAPLDPNGGFPVHTVLVEW